jgi:hypothetical protein
MAGQSGRRHRVSAAAIVVAVVVAACSGKSERAGSNAGGRDEGGGTAGDERGGTTGSEGGGTDPGGDSGEGGGASGRGGPGPATGGISGSGGVLGGSGGVPAGMGGFSAGSAGFTPGGAAGFAQAGSAGVGSPSSVPSCLRALFDDPPTEGPCRIEHSEDSLHSRSCFDSQVRQETDWTGCIGGGIGSTSERRVYRSDGTLCYRVATVFGPACESGTETWTDGNGDPVATQTFAYMQPNVVTCENGEPQSCGAVGSCWTDWPNPMCVLGSCPAVP